jgi:hypothetical protein
MVRQSGDGEERAVMLVGCNVAGVVACGRCG